MKKRRERPSLAFEPRWFMGALVIGYNYPANEQA